MNLYILHNVNLIKLKERFSGGSVKVASLGRLETSACGIGYLPRQAVLLKNCGKTCNFETILTILAGSHNTEARNQLMGK